MILSKPEAKEYGEYYAGYIKLVEADDPIWQMKKNFADTIHFLEDLPVDRWNYRYEKGKWNLKEMLAHIMDTERIMSNRALCIARGEKQSLAGFDHKAYAENSYANQRSILSLFSEYKALRPSTLELFKSIEDQPLQYTGIANDYPFSPRAIAFILAGHELHHMQVLKTRYFPELN